LSWPSVLPLVRTSRLFELPFRPGRSGTSPGTSPGTSAGTSAGTCPATGVVGHPCFGVIAFFIGKMAIIHIQQYKMMMWWYNIIIYVMWCKLSNIMGILIAGYPLVVYPVTYMKVWNASMVSCSENDLHSWFWFSTWQSWPEGNSLSVCYGKSPFLNVVPSGKLLHNYGKSPCY
jgi:hypothetical protein